VHHGDNKLTSPRKEKKRKEKKEKKHQELSWSAGDLDLYNPHSARGDLSKYYFESKRIRTVVAEVIYFDFRYCTPYYGPLHHRPMG
jgi:hypothetical protein